MFCILVIIRVVVPSQKEESTGGENEESRGNVRAQAGTKNKYGKGRVCNKGR